MLITLARKPLTGAVVTNALQHGCGALNIDGCQVGTSGARRKSVIGSGEDSFFAGLGRATKYVHLPMGRWPTNLLRVAGHGPDVPYFRVLPAGRAGQQGI